MWKNTSRNHEYFVIDEMSYDDATFDVIDNVKAKVLNVKQIGGDDLTVSILVEYQSEELVIERSLSEFHKTHKVLMDHFGVLKDFKWTTSRRWIVPGYAAARAVISRSMPPANSQRLQPFLDKITDLRPLPQPVLSFLSVDILQRKDDALLNAERQSLDAWRDSVLVDDHFIRAPFPTSSVHPFAAGASISLESNNGSEAALKNPKIGSANVGASAGPSLPVTSTLSYWLPSSISHILMSQLALAFYVSVFTLLVTAGLGEVAKKVLLDNPYLACLGRPLSLVRSSNKLLASMLNTFAGTLPDWCAIDGAAEEYWVGSLLSLLIRKGAVLKGQLNLLLLLLALTGFYHRLLGQASGAFLRHILGWTPKNGKFFLEIEWISLRLGLDKNQIVVGGVSWRNPPQFKKPFFLTIRELTVSFDAVSVLRAVRSGGSSAIHVHEITLDKANVHLESDRPKPKGSGCLNVWACLGAETAEEEKAISVGVWKVGETGRWIECYRLFMCTSSVRKVLEFAEI